MDLSDLKWVSKRNLQTFWDGIKGSLFGDLAFHEDGTESAHAYNAGDLLGHESHLYRATSNIAAGDTLESGVNMERTLVDAEIKRSRQSVNTEFDPRLSNILGDLATVEAEMVATQNYNKGDYIVIGDYFYKATNAITSGDTLAVGTNIERTNVGAEVSELNSNKTKELDTTISIQSSAAVNFIDAFLTGNVVVTDIVLNSNADLATNAQLGSITLPRNLASECHMPVLTSSGNMARVRIEKTGRISVENPVAQNQYIAVSMVGLLS